MHVPVRWVIDGLDAMTWRGQPFSAALLPSGVWKVEIPATDPLNARVDVRLQQLAAQMQRTGDKK